MKHLTGTNVYKLLDCRRAVALDLAGDRSLKREVRPEEEFVLKRGRDHEDRLVTALGWPEPAFEAPDWAAGAAATEAMLREGIEGVSQGILVGEGRLGIPDLLRRETGASALGDFHYVIGDIKSSAAPRADQVLQVAFYSEMLAQLQDRRPTYGYLLLKDGREERFDLADFAPALEQVEEELAAIQAAPDAVEPFYQASCDRCAWSPVCMPELEAADDLSFLPGVTPTLRAALRRAGPATCAALAKARPESLAKAAGVEPARVRQLIRAAQARVRGVPLAEPRSKHADDPGDAAFLHVLTDPFADRLLWLGVLHPARSGGTLHECTPSGRDAEWDAFVEVLAQLPPATRLLHYGPAVLRWHEEQSFGRSDSIAFESRFVDIGRRLRGAMTPTQACFSLEDLVRVGLDRDPHRMGRAAAAALHAEAGETDWLVAKGRADLEDLAALAERWIGPDATGLAGGA